MSQQQQDAETTIETARQAFEFPMEQAVDYQRTVAQLVLNSLRMGDWIQSRGIDLTQDAFSSYLRTLENTKQQMSQVTQSAQGPGQQQGQASMPQGNQMSDRQEMQPTGGQMSQPTGAPGYQDQPQQPTATGPQQAPQGQYAQQAPQSQYPQQAPRSQYPQQAPQGQYAQQAQQEPYQPRQQLQQPPQQPAQGGAGTTRDQPATANQTTGQGQQPAQEGGGLQEATQEQLQEPQ